MEEPTGGMDFNRRLEEALARAKGKAQSSAPERATAPATDGGLRTDGTSDDFSDIMRMYPSRSPDDFTARLAGTMARARGDAPADSPAAADSGEATETDEFEDPATGPVGQGDYVVRAGQCIASIAYQAGLSWETIWDDPANAELREVRGDPNILLEGDRVTVREKQRRDEALAPEQRHRFKRVGEPVFLKLRFQEFEEPRSGDGFELYIDNKFFLDGNLDQDGQLITRVPSKARRAKVLIYDMQGYADEHIIELGKLPPITELSGVKARLANLGYPIGPIDDDWNAQLWACIDRFKKSNELPRHLGDWIDEATRAKLVEVHGS